MKAMQARTSQAAFAVNTEGKCASADAFISAFRFSESFQEGDERVRRLVAADFDGERCGAVDRFLQVSHVGVFWRSRILELSE